MFIPTKIFTKTILKFNNKINKISYEEMGKEIEKILNNTN